MKDPFLVLVVLHESLFVSDYFFPWIDLTFLKVLVCHSFKIKLQETS